MDRKKKERLQKLYAAWGTTREEHIAQMMELIDHLNAKVEREEGATAAASGTTVSVAEPAKRRAAASPKAAAKRQFVFASKAEIVDRLKDRAAKETRLGVARIAAQKKSTSPDTLEIEGLGLNVECLKDSGILMTTAAANGIPGRLRHGKTKSSLRNPGSKSSKDRRRR
jgi:hypothetical protein